MYIAVLSDSHDHIWNLEKVVNEIKHTTKAVIFCGDLIAPFSSQILSQTNLPTYICLGNNDEDHIGLQKMGGKKFTWFHLSQEFGEIELDHKKIAFCHYPRLAELLAQSGQHHAVFFGHTHEVKNKKIGNTLLLNPGSICGINAGKPAPASYAIYDTSTNSAKIINLS